MKILAMSDLHGHQNSLYLLRERIQLDRPDLVILAGDITNFGPTQFARDVIDTLGNTPCMMIPGNCDMSPVKNLFREAGLSIQEEFRPLEKYTFIGLGGSPPPRLEIPEIPDLVFVSHIPPYGYNDGAPRGHIGSKRLLEMVKEQHPILVISGHVHETQGVIEDDGTIFVNVGAAMDGHYAIIELNRSIKVELR